MWKKYQVDNLIYYSLPHWQKLGAKVIMTTRHGGQSKEPYNSLNLGLHVGDDNKDVIANRQRVLALLDCNIDYLITANQTHGTYISVVESCQCGLGAKDMVSALQSVDGMITVDRNVVLAMHYADCLPVALFDPVNKIMGVVHAGWRGTFDEIVVKAIDKMCLRYGSDRSKILAALGPSIGQCCYEVDENFYSKFKNKFENCDDWFIMSDSKYRFDIKLANYDQLIKSRISKNNIDILDKCTGCSHEEFFSYRYDNGITGRMGLYMKLGV